MRGSVNRRVGKHGVTYQVRVEYPPDPVTGKRTQRSESYPTEDEAERRLAEWLVDLHRGTAVDPAKMTVGAYLDHWLATYARTNVRATTYTSYATRVEMHLKPRLGHHQLAKLRPTHIQAALAGMAADGHHRPRGDRAPGAPAGISPATVRRVHQVLSQALKHAVEWGLIASNPAAIARPGRAKRPELHIWDGDQLRDFLRATSDDQLWGPLWLLAIATGLRQGELLALGWQQVDLKRRRLHVTRTLAMVTDGTPIFQPPKTDRSRRVVPLDAHCVAILTDHQRAQRKQRMRYGPAWSDHDLVFTVDHGGPILGPNVTHRFQRLAKQAGLPVIRFHDLRHSHATLLLREGVPVKIVSERLGHDSISITLDMYSHVLPDMQQMAVDALEVGLFQGLVNKSVNKSG